MKSKFFAVLTLLSFFALGPVQAQSTPNAKGMNQSELRDQFNQAVEVKNIKVEPNPNKLQPESVVVTLEVTNISDKKIAGIRVVAQSNDVFGKRLDGIYGFETDKDIKPGETITLSTIRDGRQFLKAERSKTKQIGYPIHVIFEDGTEIKNPRFN